MGFDRPLIRLIAGSTALLSYMSLSFAAFAFYPAAFGPHINWLSDLGNRLLNPDGAIYYRLAGIVAATCLLIFFIFLPDRPREQQKSVRVLSLLVSAIGMLASVSFGLTGMYSEDMMPMHSWFSMTNFAAFGTAIALTTFLSGRNGWIPRWFMALCITAWGFDLASAFFGNTRWLEWVVVAFLIAYIAGLSIFSARTRHAARRRLS
jgi:hypothetical membrane protein